MPNLELQRALTRIAEQGLAEIRPAAGSAGEAIGRASAVDGEAYAVRADGTRVPLEVNTPIFQGDTLETGGGGLGVVFVDGTSFTMGPDARMVVDEFVFDPAGGDGAMAVSLVEGLFIYVSGEVAHQNPDDVVLVTPVATIGIRGTAIAVQAGPPGGINMVSLLVAPDETLGKVVVTNAGGSAVLDEVNETTTIAGADAAPSTGYFLSEQQIVQLYGLPLLLSPYEGDLQAPDGGGAQDGGAGEAQEGEAEAPTEEAQLGEPGEAPAPETGPGAPQPDEALLAPLASPDADTSGFVSLETGLIDAPPGAFETTISFALGLPEPGILGAIGGSFTAPETTLLAFAPPPPPPTDAGEFVVIASDPLDQPDAGTGDASNNVLLGDAGPSTLSGLDGDDVLDGGAGDDTLSGGAGRDMLLGGTGNDRLDGGAGDDIIAPGDGADVILGGVGLDIVLFSDVSLGLLQSLSDDLGGGATTSAATASGVLLAGALAVPIDVDFAAGTVTQAGVVMTFADIEGIAGTPLADVFRDAGAGHEFDGGAGDDTFIGVAGSVLHYTMAGAGVVVDLAAGVGQGDATVGRDTLIGIRSVEGSGFGDVILGSAADNTLFGEGGNDSLDGRSGADLLDGDDGNDVLTDSDGADLLLGNMGNDLLIVADDFFADVFDGGPGDDTLSFAGLAPAFTVDLRVNQVYGGALDVVTDIENVIGGAGADTLLGDLNNNKLQGGAGNDYLQGGLGDDMIDGGAGFDTASYADISPVGGVTVDLLIGGPQSIGAGAGNDTLVSIEAIEGSVGNDILKGNNGANGILGGAGNDSVFGRAGDDQLFGDAGDDSLLGELGNDVLDGGLGNDVLDGGGGGDAMFGGSGQDFFFTAPSATEANYTPFASTGFQPGIDFDTIVDFSRGFGDSIRIAVASVPGVSVGPLVTGVNFSVITGSYDSVFAGTNANFAAGQATFVFSQSDGVLFFDDNGANPGYSVVAEIQGGITPGTGDILVV